MNNLRRCFQSWVYSLKQFRTCNITSRSVASYDNLHGSGDNATKTKSTTETLNGGKKIRKSVLLSQSHDVITNMALEEWLFKNVDFDKEYLLLLWINDPCVVIGNHQNPFAEANVSWLTNKDITLARRKSGGGTVYHDRGNLNCTFFTPKNYYNRKHNLQIISNAIYRNWNISLEINDRDDLMLSKDKVSGTAAKIARSKSYHHCTLLVNADLEILRGSLAKGELNYTTKATKSTRSSIQNLAGACPLINVDNLTTAIADEYLRTLTLEVGNKEVSMEPNGFGFCNPIEYYYPGIDILRAEYASWAHVFGKTPKFTVEKEVEIDVGKKLVNALLRIEVEGGLMRTLDIIVPDINESFPLVTAFRGQPYTEQCLGKILEAIKLMPNENVKLAMNMDEWRIQPWNV